MGSGAGAGIGEGVAEMGMEERGGEEVVCKEEKDRCEGGKFHTKQIRRHVSSMQKMHMFKRTFIRRTLGHFNILLK